MEQTVGTTRQPGKARRTWLAAAIAIAALIAIAAVAVVLVGSRENATYEAGSPEAAVQEYVEAWATGDADAAWGMLTPRVQKWLDEREFRATLSWEEGRPSRVWIEERRDLPDWVTLTLSVERSWDGLFGPSRETESTHVKLVEVDGAWRIDTPLLGYYPW
jgi:hypothetical protein